MIVSVASEKGKSIKAKGKNIKGIFQSHAPLLWVIDAYAKPILNHDALKRMSSLFFVSEYTTSFIVDAQPVVNNNKKHKTMEKRD